jgi:hypothetical protein
VNKVATLRNSRGGQVPGVFEEPEGCAQVHTNTGDFTSPALSANGTALETQT